MLVRAPEIRNMRASLGLSQESFSRVLDVTARSVERWEARDQVRLDADTSRRVQTVLEIASLAQEVYGAEAERFYATPRRSLDMRTPREAMVHGDLEEVRQLLLDALEGHWA